MTAATQAVGLIGLAAYGGWVRYVIAKERWTRYRPNQGRR